MFLSQVRGPEVVKCNAFVCTDVKKITNQFKHQSSITISIHTGIKIHALFRKTKYNVRLQVSMIYLS